MRLPSLVVHVAQRALITCPLLNLVRLFVVVLCQSSDRLCGAGWLTWWCRLATDFGPSLSVTASKPPHEVTGCAHQPPTVWGQGAEDLFFFGPPCVVKNSKELTTTPPPKKNTHTPHTPHTPRTPQVGRRASKPAAPLVIMFNEPNPQFGINKLYWKQK